MMNKKTFFKLFTNCKVVKGHRRSTICDLHRGKVYSIPNSLAVFVEESDNKNMLDYISGYSDENQRILRSYIHFLEKNEFGFWTDTPERFPDLNLIWKTPELINNAILEIEGLDQSDIKKIGNSLELMACKFLEIRLYTSTDMEKLGFLMKAIQATAIRSVTIYSCYENNMPYPELEQLLADNNRITLFVLHSCDKEKKELPVSDFRIQVIKRKIDSALHCGMIEPKSFASNIPVFTESLVYNSCLNRKVAVTIKGEIKNCPSMLQSFGHIKDESLEKIVAKEEFQKLWKINKDKINVCSDCEFRRVCTDCRAYLENPDDIYSKPLKCGYDPYSATWKKWTDNPLKQEVVDYYSNMEAV